MFVLLLRKKTAITLIHYFRYLYVVQKREVTPTQDTTENEIRLENGTNVVSR